jgi:hypothetical protein
VLGSNTHDDVENESPEKESQHRRRLDGVRRLREGFENSGKPGCTAPSTQPASQRREGGHVTPPPVGALSCLT